MLTQSVWTISTAYRLHKCTQNNFKINALVMFRTYHSSWVSKMLLQDYTLNATNSRKWLTNCPPTDTHRTLHDSRDIATIEENNQVKCLWKRCLNHKLFTHHKFYICWSSVIINIQLVYDHILYKPRGRKESGPLISLYPLFFFLYLD